MKEKNFSIYLGAIVKAYGKYWRVIAAKPHIEMLYAQELNRNFKCLIPYPFDIVE